ncbi:hypothetical protein SAY87_003232 [Trapa incisa]|uniref:C2 domain-containing protein n=1 Tax=Trapa incisa TaxID=236973 RepID=A0AAN7QHE6_9MYRT|nr:hypothetical protein SAY87_003232 [Trapa incisa]
MPGPIQVSLEKNLHILWFHGKSNFITLTMMRGMTEGGVRQGLKEGFEHSAIGVCLMVSHFVKARLKKGGDGWILTIALIGGVNFASLNSNSTGLSDPYVVLACNGRTRTKILEFDPMEEPPSVFDVEVFDFDGPFNQATSLEHAEINFLKHTDTELADMWVFLEGKLIQSSQSKLHLRIFWTKIMGWKQLRNTYQKWKRKSGRRTFMALWSKPPLEQKAQISEDQDDQDELIVLDGEYIISSLVEVFGSGILEYRVMEKSECLNYATTDWETVRLGVFERSVSYKFNHYVSIFGGEVTCTQQKTSNKDG